MPVPTLKECSVFLDSFQKNGTAKRREVAREATFAVRPERFKLNKQPLESQAMDDSLSVDLTRHPSVSQQNCSTEDEATNGYLSFLLLQFRQELLHVQILLRNLATDSTKEVLRQVFNAHN